MTKWYNIKHNRAGGSFLCDSHHCKDEDDDKSLWGTEDSLFNQ